MRVFVTGATGTIGSVVVPELVAGRHEVLALARSDASARQLKGMGLSVLRGDINDAESLRIGANQCDAVIHLAWGPMETISKSIDEETAAIEALGDALGGSGKALVIASGTPVIPGRVSTEDDPPMVEGPLGGRGRNAQSVIGLADRDIRSAVVRLPRSVHAQGERSGFASVVVDVARRNGVAGYVGDGTQRWPAVHRLDAASLFRLVLEQAAPGTVAHAVADEGDTMRSIAETIGVALGLPTRAVPPESYGFLGEVCGIDAASSSAITQQTFGWRPKHPSLLEDLAAGGYPDDLTF